MKAAQAAWKRLPPASGRRGPGPRASLPGRVRSLLPRSSARPGGEPPALTARRYRLVADPRQAGRRADEVAREWLARGPGDGALAGGRAPPDHGRRPARARPAPAGARASHRRAARPSSSSCAPSSCAGTSAPRPWARRAILYEDDALIAVDKPPRAGHGAVRRPAPAFSRRSRRGAPSIPRRWRRGRRRRALSASINVSTRTRRASCSS